MDICGYTDTEKTIVHETDGCYVDGGSQPGSFGLLPWSRLLSRLGDERALGFADGGVRSRRLRGLCLDFFGHCSHLGVDCVDMLVELTIYA